MLCLTMITTIVGMTGLRQWQYWAGVNNPDLNESVISAASQTICVGIGLPVDRRPEH